MIDLRASDSLVMPPNQAVHPMLVLVLLTYGRSELIGKSDILVDAERHSGVSCVANILLINFDSHLASDNV